MPNVTVFGIPAQLLHEGRGADLCCAKNRLLRPRGAKQKRIRDAYRFCLAWLLAGSMGFLGVTQAASEPICKPALAIKGVQFSPMQPPTMERRWTATVVTDASRCATTAGYFELGFSRLKENGIEVELREQFIWSSPSATVGVDFWADEAVESYWIDSVQSCPCAK